MLTSLLIAAAISSIDPSLLPPADSTLVASTEGGGVQVYGCAANSDGASSWTLIEPEASLFDPAGKPFGTHGKGPTWTALDGSTIAADGKTPLARVARPAAVPELLLKVVSGSGNGVLSGVRFVQRIETVGGSAPVEICNSEHTGERRAVPYAAIYRFFK